jgi:hypothetical protein
MEADPVREALHQRNDRLSGLGTRVKGHTIHAFVLEGSEERLGDGVLPTIAFAAQTDGATHFHKQRLRRMAGVWTSPIGVVQ